MRITFDPAKPVEPQRGSTRDTTLQERGLDFADAAVVFDRVTIRGHVMERAG